MSLHLYKWIRGPPCRDPREMSNKKFQYIPQKLTYPKMMGFGKGGSLRLKIWPWWVVSLLDFWGVGKWLNLINNQLLQATRWWCFPHPSNKENIVSAVVKHREFLFFSPQKLFIQVISQTNLGETSPKKTNSKEESPIRKQILKKNHLNKDTDKYTVYIYKSSFHSNPYVSFNKKPWATPGPWGRTSYLSLHFPRKRRPCATQPPPDPWVNGFRNPKANQLEWC